uniref:Uncharacterized protein n=1 Tax=Pygocentrus nattereri TaxID=42514 RepID=A0AAR2M094_PYGNA
MGYRRQTLVTSEISGFECIICVFTLFVNVRTCVSACNCNGKSAECYFDQELYRNTGHGGHCRNCADNTDGPNCERCLDNYYRDASGQRCLPCSCNPVGSLSTQCDNSGRCSCKPGVMGDKCDRCQPGFHTLTQAGCRPCSCNPAGSTQECDVNTGRCQCKDNVDGFSCDRCKLGYFNLDSQNPQGCTPCFCFLHSTVCESADGYSINTITSTFNRDDEGWKGQQRDGSSVPVHWSASSQEISLISDDYFPMYFVAPAKFLGNHLLSYGQNLTLNFRVERRDTRLSAEDVVLEGAGFRVAVPLIAQGNAYPGEQMQTFVFRLHQTTDYSWKPMLKHGEFQKLLHNLTSIKIRGTYSERSAGYLDNASLVTARRGPGTPARWVEKCNCPQGYVGQHCGQCAVGYRRSNPELGQYSPCEPCNCNGHSDTCDSVTGMCNCQDNTAGMSCERCKDGYYGDATVGSSSDCKPCPCPSGATCAIVPKTKDVVCTNCPAGTTGKRCELCDDGFFGDPLGTSGPVRACRACKCSDNIDPNAVGNCDRETGECLKCIYNTDGFFCDRCKEGFYGNALAANPADKCKPCDCDPEGSRTAQCRDDGYCECRPGFQCPNCYSLVRDKVRPLLDFVFPIPFFISDTSLLYDVQTADQLLARADAAKALAEEAAKKGMSTYQEAQDILNNLRDFDKRVNDNKTAAEEAMKRIPEINATINAANEKTRQAEGALGNAAADAKEAKSKAEEAEKIASNVQKGSAKTKADAEKAFEDTMKLDKEVNDMMNQLAAAEKELGAKTDEANQDMMMAGMVSTGLLVLLLNHLSFVHPGNIDKVDLSKLDQIDNSLKEAKEKMAGSELDKKLKELNDIAKSQEGMINDYDRQIREIRADIANLNDIKNTLPEGCFNTPSLERP